MVVRDAWPVWARAPRSTGAPPALPPPLAGRTARPPHPPRWLGLFAPIGLVVSFRTTPETLVRQAQIPDEVDSPRSVRQVSRQLDVSTPLTPAAGHLRCLDLGRSAEEVSHLLDAGSAHPQQGRRSVRDCLIPAPSSDWRMS